MFRVGERIAHPMHGAGVIEGIEERLVDGRRESYYALRLLSGGLRLLVPVSAAGSLGLRPTAGKEKLDRLLRSIPALDPRMEQNWNRRYRENMDRLRTGDLTELARVIKGLSLRDRETGLSTGERKMLWSAKQILLSEIQLTEDVTCDEAERMLSRALEERPAE